MLNHLRLFTYSLDLDKQWVAQQDFDEVAPDELPSMQETESAWEPDWRTCIQWIAPLMKHSLDANASAIYLCLDLTLECLRQFILLRKGLPDRETCFWFELTPMAWPMGYAGLRAVRFMSMMLFGAKNGSLYYRYKGKKHKALCYRQSKDQLVICFSNVNPQTLPNLDDR